MQKTKMGIPLGMLAAAIYFAGLFGGYVAVILLTAYVLLVEDNEWLRRSGVKAVILMVMFSLIDIVLGFLPDVLNVISSFAGLFAIRFTYSALSQVMSILESIFGIIKYILFIALGMKALGERSLSLPIVDKLIYKYMG